MVMQHSIPPTASWKWKDGARVGLVSAACLTMWSMKEDNDVVKMSTAIAGYLKLSRFSIVDVDDDHWRTNQIIQFPF